MSRLILIIVGNLALIFPAQATHQPPVTQRRHPAREPLEQRLARESNADITGPTLSILFSRPPPKLKPRDSNDNSVPFVENLLSPHFPDLVLRVRSATSIKATQLETSDSGNGKARVVDDEEPKDIAQKPGLADVASTSGTRIFSRRLTAQRPSPVSNASETTSSTSR